MPEPTGPVRLGIVCRPDPPVVAELEAMPLDSLWVGGHVCSAHATEEPMGQLARLSALSTRARIGTAVVPLPLYPPAIVAKQVADLDQATEGRVSLGVGTGGEYPQEFRACEVSPQGRGGRLDEQIALLRALWSGSDVTHRGRHHTVVDVRMRPTPRRPGGVPILVAGRGPRAMRRAGRLGDGWLPYLYSPVRYAESVVAVEAQRVAAGRAGTPFEWAVFLFCRIGVDGPAARAEAVAALTALHGRDAGRLLGRGVLAGTRADVATEITAYLRAGARHLVVAPLGPDPLASARVLAEEIVPLARGRPGPQSTRRPPT